MTRRRVETTFRLTSGTCRRAPQRRRASWAERDGWGLASALTPAAGCGNDIDINDKLGITVDAAGTPVLVAEVCHGLVAQVYTFDGQGSAARSLRPTSPRTESFTVELSAPGRTWRGDPPALPWGPGLNSAEATGGDDADSALSQVDFTAADVAELTPDTLQYDGRYLGSGHPEDYGTVHVERSHFHDLACSTADSG